MRLIDVSVPVRAGMAVWPGDPTVELERVASIEEGSEANVSRAAFGVHVGTHVDAPLHFVRDGSAIDALALNTLIGAAAVVDVGDADIDAAVVARAPRVERLLFKTTNGRLWERSDFSAEYARVTRSGAEALAARGVVLIGVDYLSVGDSEVHRILLEEGIVIVEGLDLRDAPPGTHQLFCLPLKLAGSEGAPARVVLGVDADLPDVDG